MEGTSVGTRRGWDRCEWGGGALGAVVAETDRMVWWGKDVRFLYNMPFLYRFLAEESTHVQHIMRRVCGRNRCLE